MISGSTRCVRRTSRQVDNQALAWCADGFSIKPNYPIYALFIHYIEKEVTIIYANSREEERNKKINTIMEMMNGWGPLMLDAAIVLLISMEMEFAQGQQGGGKVDLTKKAALDPASTNYIATGTNRRTGQEQAFCLARGKCRRRILSCP